MGDWTGTSWGMPAASLERWPSCPPRNCCPLFFVSMRHSAAIAVTACGILRPYPSPMSQMKDSASPDVGTITVSVTFFADLRRFLPRGADGPQSYRLTSGATLGDLLATIGIKPDADVTLALDGELAERDTPLYDGADVMLLSPME